MSERDRESVRRLATSAVQGAMRKTLISTLGLVMVALPGCDKPDEAPNPSAGQAAADDKAPDSAEKKPAPPPDAAPVPRGPAPPLPKDPEQLNAAVSKLVGVENANLTLGSAESDGQRVRGLACNAARLPLMGSMALLGSISAQKAELDACAPEGDAAVVRWDIGKDGAANVKVSGGSSGEADRCIQTAMKKTTAPFSGSCGVVLLVGENAGADEAFAHAVAPHV